MKITSRINNKNQEVVICANPEQLEQLGKWLIIQANTMKSNSHYSHEHSKGNIANWHENWPDIIVYNPKNII